MLLFKFDNFVKVVKFKNRHPSLFSMKKLLILTALILNGLAAFGQTIDVSNQPKENSPLSRLGFGNLTPQYLASSAGFGGMTAAYRDRFSFNPFNPASVASMRMTAYEVGFFAKNNAVKSGTNNSSAWSGNLNYLALGFPTYSVINEVLDRKKRETRWGMGFSLMPYSTVGYNINSISKITDTVNIANYFLGSGSTYRFLWSNGVSYKGLSVGANVGFLFGRTASNRQLELSSPSSTGLTYNDNFDDSYTMAGFSWNLGAQYDIAIGAAPKVGEKDKQRHLVLGVYGNPTTPFTTTSNQLYQRILPGIGADSITGFSDKKGTGKLPAEVTAGVMYEDGLTFRIGAEYKFSAWSGYKNDARPQTLKDAGVFSVGSEFILDRSKLKSPEEKIRYRLGFKTGTDPRVLNGNQVSTWAATAGLCFPMRVGRGSQISYLNLGLEYGKLDAKVLSETYYRINLGFTLNDNTWFLKRKFN
jgi:hypothetical protein